MTVWNSYGNFKISFTFLLFILCMTVRMLLVLKLCLGGLYLRIPFPDSKRGVKQGRSILKLGTEDACLGTDRHGGGRREGAEPTRRRKYIKEGGRDQEQSGDPQGNHPVTQSGEKSPLKLCGDLSRWTEFRNQASSGCNASDDQQEELALRNPGLAPRGSQQQVGWHQPRVF